MTMTAAEMRTLREALGLPATWLAAQAQVQERTVRHWESGRNAVPGDVAAMLRRIDAAFDTSAGEAVRQYADAALSTAGAPQEVVLLRYRTDDDLWLSLPDMRPLPATAHAAMLHRAWKALAARGAAVRIVYLDVEDYEAWRATNGRDDGPSVRAEWAAASLALREDRS